MKVNFNTVAVATTVLLVLALFSGDASAVLPGMQQKNYEVNEDVQLKVNKITSVHTQIPYRYYSIPGVCKPKNIKNDKENLGEILLGDRIESSLYDIKFLQPVACNVLNFMAPNGTCPSQMDAKQLKTLSDYINDDYKVQWMLDGLPARTSNVALPEPGFALGFVGTDNSFTKTEKGKNYLYNHVDIEIEYHNNTQVGALRIVGFIVSPKSREYPDNGYTEGEQNPLCPVALNAPQTVTSNSERILWTYSVQWVEKTGISWAHRWDAYLRPTETSNRIHWFSILNSLMIVFFLTVMVAMIMMRTLKADFRKYNSIDTHEEAEETGWKMIHGDVFRPPSRPMFLSVLVGSGVQVFAMSMITMVFAVIGFLAPSNIGGLATSLVVLYIIMAMFAGYFSTRNYVIFKGTHWKKNTLYTAFALPGMIFFIFFVINMFLRHKGSSAAVPFTTFLSLIAMWFGISVPLVFCGSYFAFKKPVPQDPVRTNQIPRQIPDQIWYMSPAISVLMGGILPFGAVFIELYFILSALWDNQFYYIFTFLFIVLIILIITSAEITIVMCYFQLCAEDYHWWWRSFLTSGASGLFMFLYSIFFFRKLEITTFTSMLLYFGYSLIMALAFFVLTGSIGYYSCYFFVRKIYSSIHIN
eukprot:gene10724-12477_t